MAHRHVIWTTTPLFIFGSFWRQTKKHFLSTNTESSWQRRQSSSSCWKSIDHMLLQPFHVLMHVVLSIANSNHQRIDDTDTPSIPSIPNVFLPKFTHGWERETFSVFTKLTLLLLLLPHKTLIQFVQVECDDENKQRHVRSTIRCVCRLECHCRVECHFGDTWLLSPSVSVCPCAISPRIDNTIERKNFEIFWQVAFKVSSACAVGKRKKEREWKRDRLATDNTPNVVSKHPKASENTHTHSIQFEQVLYWMISIYWLNACLLFVYFLCDTELLLREQRIYIERELHAFKIYTNIRTLRESSSKIKKTFFSDNLLLTLLTHPAGVSVCPVQCSCKKHFTNSWNGYGTASNYLEYNLLDERRWMWQLYVFDCLLNARVHRNVCRVRCASTISHLMYGLVFS